MELTDEELKEIYLALMMCKRNTVLLDSSIWNLTPILAKLEDKFGGTDETV